MLLPFTQRTSIVELIKALIYESDLLPRIDGIVNFSAFRLMKAPCWIAVNWDGNPCHELKSTDEGKVIRCDMSFVNSTLSIATKASFESGT